MDNTNACLYLERKTLYLRPKILIFLLLMANMVNATLVDVSKTSLLVKNTNANDVLLLKQAFAQIIAKNTGESLANIIQNPYFLDSDIKSGIKRSYFEKIDKKYLSNKDENYYWFHVVMHQSFITDLIKRAGFSLLPHNRQEIVLWAAQEYIVLPPDPVELAEDEIAIPIQDDQQVILGPQLKYAYDDELFNYWFKNWAESLGMVFINPKIDEEDMLIVTPDSIQNLSFQAHEHTQLKYDKKLSLLMFLKRTDDDVKYRVGSFIEGGEMSIKHYQQPAIEEGELIFSIVADMAEHYANVYKVDALALETQFIQIVINGLNGFDDISTVKNYFKDLSVIEEFQIVSASKGQIVLSANMVVSNDSFVEIVKRQNILMPVENGSINQLVFNLIDEYE
ncbi:MAG: hypothetical protein AB8B80_02525 [Marinicellaceae bacterium]